jgi:hypothetical protein
VLAQRAIQNTPSIVLDWIVPVQIETKKLKDIDVRFLLWEINGVDEYLILYKTHL